jgi:hypothetical protein
MNEYEKQAQDFLKDTETKLTVKEATNFAQCPPFCESAGHVHGDHYRITLSNKQGRYTFSFWNSANDSQQGKQPTAYDVLSCLGGEVYSPDSLEDFCSEYGYDTDSRKAEKTFKASAKQQESLRRLFSTDQLEKLAEVQ